jgi:hypothetical protein
MLRHTWLIALALSTFTPMELRAQSATPPPAAGKVVAVGCVERARRNGSLAGTAVGTSASPNTAAQEANSNEPTDRFMLTGVSQKGSEPAELTSYALEGRERELADHTGHRVEVTGTLAAGNTSARGDSRSERTASGVQSLRVESFKMVSASCAAR